MTIFGIPRWLPNIYIQSWENKTCPLFTKCILLCAKTETPQLHLTTSHYDHKPTLNVPSCSIAIQVLSAVCPRLFTWSSEAYSDQPLCLLFCSTWSSFASFHTASVSPWLPLSMVSQLLAHVFSRKVILMIFPGNLDQYKKPLNSGSSPVWILVLLK